MTDSRSSPRTVLLLRLAGLALLATFYLGAGVFDHEIWPPTEPAFAGVVWSMHRTGDLLVPHINGLSYLEKPPLAYALSWAGMALAGRITPGMLRLPAALAGIGAVLIVFALARRIYSEAVAWLCALLCALTATFWGITHRASTDAIALFFVFACLGVFMTTLTPSRRTPEAAGGTLATTASTRAADLSFCALLATSFLVKNFYTFLLVVPPVAVFLLQARNYRRLLTIGLWTTVFLVAIVVPWSYRLWLEGGLGYLRVVFFDNTLGRFTHIGPPPNVTLAPLNDAFFIHKDEPRTVVFSALATEMLPWLLIQPAMLWAFFRRRSVEPWRRFLKIALVSMLVCLTLSASRVETYYRPVIFGLCLMSGEYLETIYNSDSPQGRRQRLLVTANFVIVGLLLAAAPLGAAHYLKLPELRWLAPVLGLSLIAAVLLSKARWHKPVTTVAWGLLVAVLVTVNIAFVDPPLDARRSWRPFFDEIRNRLEIGQTLWTTIVDDRHLPAVNFYLDRRVTILDNLNEVPELLTSHTAEAVIMTARQFAAVQPRLAGIRYRALRAPGDHDQFVYVDNGGSGRRGCTPTGGCLSSR